MRSTRARWRTPLTMLGTVCLGVAGCSAADQPVARASRFQSDVAFLRQHTQVVLLTDPSGAAQVAVGPAYQGRVMTSTTGGRDAPSFGWIGRPAIAAGHRQSHMNVFGGEDRFWLGPEGGQYAQGDVINSYNDGPPGPGKPPLGPFYELETSSPALSLAPAQHYTHVHRTFHLVGPEAELDRIAHATLTIGLAELTNAFVPSTSGK